MKDVMPPHTQMSNRVREARPFLSDRRLALYGLSVFVMGIYLAIVTLSVIHWSALAGAGVATVGSPLLTKSISLWVLGTFHDSIHGPVCLHPLSFWLKGYWADPVASDEPTERLGEAADRPTMATSPVRPPGPSKPLVRSEPVPIADSGPLWAAFKDPLSLEALLESIEDPSVRIEIKRRIQELSA